MAYFYWISGIILALAWASRIVDAALGMPSVADVSRPEWDRNPVSAAGNPRDSILPILGDGIDSFCGGFPDGLEAVPGLIGFSQLPIENFQQRPRLGRNPLVLVQ